MIHTVLIAEHDPFELARLEGHCRDAGLRVLTAGDGEQVLSSIARERPDTLLLRDSLPRLTGMDVLGILRSDPMLESLWVIMIVDAESDHEGAPALDAGADDVISRPYLLAEVRIRITSRGRRSSPSIPHEAPGIPEHQGQRPGGVSALYEALRYEIHRGGRYHSPVVCMVLRIAEFPALIARGGTAASDALTESISTTLLPTLRQVDYVFQSSAGEFSFVLPETNREGAESLQQRLAEIWLALPQDITQVGEIQIGYATWVPNDDEPPTPQELRQRAQDAATTVRSSTQNRPS